MIFSHLRKFILAWSVGLRSAPRILTEASARKLAAEVQPRIFRVIVSSTVVMFFGTFAIPTSQTLGLLMLVVVKVFIVLKTVVAEAVFPACTASKAGEVGRTRVATGKVRPAPRLRRGRTWGLPRLLTGRLTARTTVKTLAGVVLAQAHVLGLGRAADTAKQGVKAARPTARLGRTKEDVAPSRASPASRAIVRAGAPSVTPLGNRGRGGRPRRVGP